MTVMLELEKRVGEAQEKLSVALAELSTFAEFKKRLEAAGTGLSSSSTALTAFAQKVESHTESLAEAAKSLSAAVEVMKQTDFGEIRESLSELKSDIRLGHEGVLTQVQGLADDIGKTAVSNHDATVSQLTQMSNRLSGLIREATTKSSSEVVGSLAEKVDHAAGASKMQAAITWILVAISILLTAYSIVLQR